MITIDKLKIFEKYNGDGDTWNRIGLKDEKNILTFSDWNLINDLLQDLNFTEFLSRNYKIEAFSKIKLNCVDAETSDYLLRMAGNFK